LPSLHPSLLQAVLLLLLVLLDPKTFTFTTYNLVTMAIPFRATTETQLDLPFPTDEIAEKLKFFGHWLRKLYLNNDTTIAAQVSALLGRRQDQNFDPRSLLSVFFVVSVTQYSNSAFTNWN